MVRKGMLMLVAGFAFGYCMGFTDADRGDGTLGARVGALVQRVHPDKVRETRAQEAERLRQHVNQQSGVNP